MADTTTAASQTSAPSIAAPILEPLSPVSTPRTASGITALAGATQLLRPSSPRKRQRTPEGRSTSARSPSPVSPKTLLATAQTLTGASEMEQQKEAKKRRITAEKETAHQTSDNPSAKAVSALMGLDNGQSRPEDAPASAANTLSEPIAAIAPSITSVGTQEQDAAGTLTSPVSTASVATREGAATAIAVAQAPVASPGQLGDDEGIEVKSQTGDRPNRSYTVDSAGAGAKSLTYPGPLASAQLESGRRNHSLDSGMPRDEARSSSSNKKHKCPYCSTEFTRHHNLKSHLLTHSHEKPYFCRECDSRFRRLHDLKRHTKLHTGERPHVCPICKRSFARGDALARHNKGQGGCAGRRSSAGSFNGEGTEEPMDGMIYTSGDASQEPEHMDTDGEGTERGSNVPSIRHHDAQGHPSRADTQSYQRQPSTYPPPPASRASLTGSLYPPNTQHGGPNGPQSPGLGSSYPPPGYSGSSYGQPSMTESPKPLSPRLPMASDARNRSPSASHQLPGNPFASGRQSSRSDPSLPPPAAPTLPPPPGMNLGPPDARYSVGLNAPPGSGGTSYPPPGGSFPAPASGGSVHNSASNSLSSHGTGQAGSGERGALPFANDERMWAFVRNLEAKIDRLEGEVGSLKQQLSHYQQQAPQHTLPQPQAPPR